MRKRLAEIKANSIAEKKAEQISEQMISTKLKSMGFIFQGHLYRYLYGNRRRQRKFLK